MVIICPMRTNQLLEYQQFFISFSLAIYLIFLKLDLFFFSDVKQDLKLESKTVHA